MPLERGCEPTPTSPPQATGTRDTGYAPTPRPHCAQAPYRIKANRYRKLPHVNRFSVLGTGPEPLIPVHAPLEPVQNPWFSVPRPRVWRQTQGLRSLLRIHGLRFTLCAIPGPHETMKCPTWVMACSVNIPNSRSGFTVVPGGVVSARYATKSLLSVFVLISNVSFTGCRGEPDVDPPRVNGMVSNMVRLPIF